MAMDERQQSKIALIVAHELDLARREIERKSEEIFAAHSAKGILGSGATVKVVSRAVGTGSEQLLATLIEKVGGIVRNSESHDQIVSALDQHFANMEVEVIKSARIASRRGQEAPHPSILQAAMGLFDQIKADIRTKLEIARFDFEVAKQAPEQPGFAAVVPPIPKNKGGKPLAAHWDAMWAHVAVQLWTGDLQPKTQADIKNAMFAWFNEKSIDVGDSAVTDRARELWRAWEAAQ